MKRLLLVGIVLLILTIIMSGCEEKTSNEEKILGTWKAIETIGKYNETIGYNNSEVNLTVTFYDNNTVKLVTENNYIEWTEYKIENDSKIIGSIYSFPKDSCNFTISKDGKYLTCIWEGSFFGLTVTGIVKFIRIE